MIPPAQAPLAGRRAAIGLSFAFILAAPVVYAGAIGMAALVSLAALIAFPRPALWGRLAPPSPGLIAAAAFLAWATLTLLWSPAEPRQILVAWAEAVLGCGLILAAAHLPDDLRTWPRLGFVVMTTALAVGLTVEAFSGGVVTALVKDLERYDARVLSMLGRGGAATIILAPAAAAMALDMGGRWKWAAWAILGGAMAAAIGFEADANILALIVAGSAFWFGHRRPGPAVMSFGLAFSAWLVLFPLGVLLAGPFIEPNRGEMPFSWEWRWEAWSYALELIAQKPLFGWGVDSARHFGDATVMMRGYELPRLPLHTHSASMQIWLELGFAGVALACAILVLGAWRVASSPRLHGRRAAAAASTAVGTAFVLSTSYGFWQEWIWCTAILAAAACFLVGPREGAKA